MNKFLKIPLIISLAAHVALIIGIIGFPDIFSRQQVPGPGENVMVWLSEPSGDTAYGPGHSAVTRKAKRRRKTVTESMGEVTPVDKIDDAGGISKMDKDDSIAGGAKAAGGPGISKGRGGNELLAKIWSQINASKYYPASARRSGIIGSPKVSFALGEDGSVKWVKLVKSSGKRILDDAALETVRRAAPLPYYPKPITVIVKYSLTR